jgi:hypothetical protein
VTEPPVPFWRIPSGPVRCGVVYVEVGEEEDGDRLVECDRRDCAEHERHLAWVHADLERFLKYVEQMRRYHQAMLPVPHEEVALL